MRASFVSLLLTTCAFAQSNHDPQALEAIKKAHEVAVGLKTIAFRATMQGEGSIATKVSVTTGQVAAQRGSGATNDVYIKGTVQRPGTMKLDQHRFALSGSTAVSIDDTSKIYASGDAKNIRGVALAGLFPPWFLGGEVFKRELAAFELKYEGSVKLDGVDCDVVKVAYSKLRRQQLKFFIGKKDHILRRMERPLRIQVKGSQSATMASVSISFTNMTINPELDSAIFKLDPPAGYSKRDIQKANVGASVRRGTLKVGEQAPAFTMTDRNGKKISLNDLRGKVIVLDFWATWCGPCRMAMPGMQKLHERFKDKPVAVYGVNCRERSSRADPMGYIDSKGFTYPQFVDGNAAATAYGVRGIPAFFVIDQEGKLLHAGSGFDPRMDHSLGQIIDRALAGTISQ